MHASFQPVNADPIVTGPIVADPGRLRGIRAAAVLPVSRVERSALVRASAGEMFALVNDVEAYPRRFGWCASAEVLARDEHEAIARLQVRLAGLRATFTTRNLLVPGRSITLSLVDGPFSRLSGLWLFTALADDACKVALTLDFDVAGRLVGGALASGFRSLADRMVDDFVREARRIDVC